MCIFILKIISILVITIRQPCSFFLPFCCSCSAAACYH